MKLRWLALSLGIVLLSVSASAQLGIYGKFVATRFSGTEGVGSKVTTWLYGPGAGVYYDFIHRGPIAVGADLRGELLSGTQQRYRSGLFGLRVSAKAPVLPVRPYIQGSAGVGGIESTNSGIVGNHYDNKFQYAVFGGVDLTIFPHIDWRLAEAGYGRMSGVGSSANVPASSIFTVSSGLVIRFP